MPSPEMRGYAPEEVTKRLAPKPEYDFAKEAQSEKEKQLERLDAYAEKFSQLQQRFDQLSTASQDERFIQLHDLVKDLAAEQNNFLSYLQNEIFHADEAGFYEGEVPKDLHQRFNEVAADSHILEVRANNAYQDMLPKEETTHEIRAKRREELEKMKTVADQAQTEVDADTDFNKETLEELRHSLKIDQDEVFTSDPEAAPTLAEEVEETMQTKTMSNREFKDLGKTQASDIPFANPEDVVSLSPEMAEKTVVEPAAQERTIVEPAEKTVVEPATREKTVVEPMAVEMARREAQRIAGTDEKTQVDANPLTELMGDDEKTQVEKPKAA